MSGKRRSVGSVKKELLTKSREATLCAIKVFNDPLVKFKSESFIVLMVIAWTYMLHAYYRSKGIDYRYSVQKLKRKRYDRTKSGAKKHWELEKCLDCSVCPIDSESQKNLRFLIGLRHEIEHQMTNVLDNFLSGHYQACAFNFNDYIKKLFGEKYALDPFLTYSIQFVEIDERQLRKPKVPETIPPNIIAYIANFNETLTETESKSSRFTTRLSFTRQLVNRPGQADQVYEFIDSSSELAKTADKVYWAKKEVERQKYRAKDVIEKVKEAGFSKFRVMPEHFQMWKKEDAKNPGKGYGTYVFGAWYWYDTWIKRCLELCEAAGSNYR